MAASEPYQALAESAIDFLFLLFLLLLWKLQDFYLFILTLLGSEALDVYIKDRDEEKTRSDITDYSLLTTPSDKSFVVQILSELTPSFTLHQTFPLIYMLSGPIHTLLS